MKIFDTRRAVCMFSKFVKLFQRNLQKLLIHENLDRRKFIAIRIKQENKLTIQLIEL